MSAAAERAVLRQAVLDQVQGAFPLVTKPYDELARRIGCTSREVLAAMDELRADGVIRRFGASFSSARLGYTSSLCALRVPGGEADIDRAAALVGAHPEITHNYRRGERYNLWFTAITRSAREREELLARIVDETGHADVLDLPSTALYKVRVDFGGARETPVAEPAGAPFDAGDPFDVALVRWAQGDARGERPFADAARAVAQATGIPSVDEERVLERLRSWKADGTMRRFGAMVMHRKMGYLYNGMAVLDANPDRIDELGRALAELPFVSHCYARVRREVWPYNLYAMAHAKSAGELASHAAAIRSCTGLEADLLVSTKEYKKSSPVYFA